MHTKTILWILGVVVVVGGGYWIVSIEKALAPGQSPVSPQEKQPTDTPLSGSGTLASVLARGGTNECTVTMKDPRASSEGTVFIAGSDIRGDFVSSAAGQKITSSMIQAGGFVYTWTNLSSQGYKAPISKSLSTDTEVVGLDPTINVSYDCKTWRVDSSKFIPPPTITFSAAQ